ncbi:MAG TPA: ABC transporter substrate-binding protein [Methylomirabilota bacterium]|nr:ABC transporter substrate-binding protein [Methylomirabilota bacterium]
MRRLAAALALVLAASLAAAAQPSGKVPRVGVLYLVSPTSSAGAPAVEAFRSSLRELGYVEGRTLIIEPRSAEGRADRLPALAADLVARKVDVIVTGGGNVSTLAARKATSTIPIVMSVSLGAVEAGLVQSLARPGGNVTGLSVPRELGAKQLELLRELVPGVSRVTAIVRPGLATAEQRAQGKAMVKEFLQVALEYVDVEEPEQLPAALAAARASRPGAVLVGPDPLFFQQRDQVLEFARTTRLPVMYPFRDFVDAGGLISYSLNAREAFRGAARYVDRILKGAKPADLPVEEPTKYELVINRKTAKALGLTIPQSLLLRADEIIE